MGTQTWSSARIRPASLFDRRLTGASAAFFLASFSCGDKKHMGHITPTVLIIKTIDTDECVSDVCCINERRWSGSRNQTTVIEINSRIVLSTLVDTYRGAQVMIDT